MLLHIFFFDFIYCLFELGIIFWRQGRNSKSLCIWNKKKKGITIYLGRPSPFFPLLSRATPLFPFPPCAPALPLGPRGPAAAQPPCSPAPSGAAQRARPRSRRPLTHGPRSGTRRCLPPPAVSKTNGTAALVSARGALIRAARAPMFVSL